MNRPEEKEKPFWNTGVHPILGYYYNGTDQSRYYFYQSKPKKKREPEWR